jgi:hypothetical protein
MANRKRFTSGQYYTKLCELARSGEYKFSEIFSVATKHFIHEGYEQSLIRNTETEAIRDFEKMIKSNLLPKVFANIQNQCKK